MAIFALARRQLVDHPPADQDVAGGRGLQPGDHPEQGGLAAARRPEEDQELALLDREVDAVHRRVAGELLAQCPGLDGGHQIGNGGR